jgi:hypothetical protein
MTVHKKRAWFTLAHRQNSESSWARRAPGRLASLLPGSRREPRRQVSRHPAAVLHLNALRLGPTRGPRQHSARCPARGARRGRGAGPHRRPAGRRGHRTPAHPAARALRSGRSHTRCRPARTGRSRQLTAIEVVNEDGLDLLGHRPQPLTAAIPADPGRQRPNPSRCPRRPGPLAVSKSPGNPDKNRDPRSARLN